jgi:hypothetical protein
MDESHDDRATVIRQPKKPLNQTDRRRVFTTKAIRLKSSCPLASAIALTPLALIPRFEAVVTGASIAVYILIKPTPAGPSNTATNFVRIIPITILMKADPPMIEDDFNTLLYLCWFALVSFSLATIETYQHKLSVPTKINWLKNNLYISLIIIYYLANI